VNVNKKTGRIVGVLYLVVFILGITIYQVLQGPNLFADDFLSNASSKSNEIILSTVLGIFSGVTSIVIAAMLLPIFKKYSTTLAFLYLAFCILNFVGIAIDNFSVLSMLELSKEYVISETAGSEIFKTMGVIMYEKHWWTHYMSLLISSLPVFILYCTFYINKLIPRVISIFGIIAVLLMFIEILSSIFDHSIGMNMLIPLALVQIILPFWLMYKGLNVSNMRAEVE
jgi:hypothetical protein